MTRADILIRNGTVVDPARELNGPGEVLIRGDRIIAAAPGEDIHAEQVVDATDCLVTPGLIDHHAHVFHGATALGCPTDAMFLPMGVTTVNDAGSAGVDTIEAMLRGVVWQSRMRVLCSLNVSSEGMTTRLHAENLDPGRHDRARLGAWLARYPAIIKGLKFRYGTELVGAFGLSALTGALETAEALHCPLTVHVGNPPSDLGALARLLRPGDIMCHPYQGIGDTILEGDGRVKEGVRDARRRGVLFDTADARRNHAYTIIGAALADGFPPDIISTDLVEASAFSDMLFGLPAVMAKYLAFGLPVLDVIRAVTATPAAVLGLAGTVGTLAPGAVADVAILALRARERRIGNLLGESMVLPRQFVPQMTILDGRIAFRQADFF